MDRESAKSLNELLENVLIIDGFPLGNQKEIIRQSDPPFYTACPNPYLKQFIEEYGKPYSPKADDYHKDPFVGDVSEGKGDPLYNAHSYHTKVPHKAIMKFIEHYTDPGDIVFDGFCGSGMTGLAAQKLERKAILIDLSSIATFISYNYNFPIEEAKWKNHIREVLTIVKKECNWMYKTNHCDSISKSKISKQKTLFDEKNLKGEINYIIWSDDFICPYCQNEYNYWRAAIEIDDEFKKFRNNVEYECPNCKAELQKKTCVRVQEQYFDPILKKETVQAKQSPVLIDYSYRGIRFYKIPDEDDLKLIEKINKLTIPYWFPSNRMPIGDESRRNDKMGITHIHHFYTKRNLWILASIWDKTKYHFEKFILTSINVKTGSKFHNVGFKKNRINLAGQVSGTLYLPSIIAERNIFKLVERKIKHFSNIFIKKQLNNIIISTQSTSNLKNLPTNCVDYIFIDPPFGSNLMYSELSFFWESWLKIHTNNKKEAIINSTQNKDILNYTDLMTECLKEMYRILKPNHWMTVEFHNSKAAVWNSIQESINKAGFIIGQVAILDKKQGTFKQQTSPGAVQSDLVINTFKPKDTFAKQFLLNAGKGMEVDFTKQQLEHIPVKPNIGRTEKMLFSKMLAYYVENGFKINYNSTEFYIILYENFVELDGYWFLTHQAKEYNKWKSGLSLEQLKVITDGQKTLFISDEKSAIAWLYFFLDKPNDYNKIFTAYQKVLMKSKDNIPEPRVLLDNNFVIEDDKYRRPLNKEEKQRINESRQKELNKEFNHLLKRAKDQKGKIKTIRIEALLYGFTKLYKEERYEEILIVANKLYSTTLESFGEIMDFVDIAKLKTEG